MSNAVQQLKTTDECDLVLEWIAEVKQDLNINKSIDVRDESKFAKNSAAIATDIIENDANISALTNILLDLSPGDLRDKKNAELLAAKSKEAALDLRLKSYNAAAAVKKEMEIVAGSVQLDAYTTKEAEVTGRKTELAGQQPGQQIGAKK